jgi:hypothetical protein
LGLYFPPWNNALEPSQGNVRQWLDNLYSKFQPIEQSRWNQSNIDTMFYAGAQEFVNRHFNVNQQNNHSAYYFNLCQQPVNMVTGYERQHRKNFSYVPTEGADAKTTDQYTKLITTISNQGAIHEQKSKAKELSAVSGMCLAQPYLDYSGNDQAQGEIKVKIWEYNAFLVDPYFRSPDMSDAQFVWCQEYITKKEAEERFPDKVSQVRPMSGTPQRYGNFYFLPENYNMARNDLMVLSYVWYKWRKKKKRLYSNKLNQFFDFAGGEENLEQILYNIEDMEAVTVDVPCWKLATVLNDQLMFQGDNPLGFDGCPFVPYFWNYEPHINHYDLRVRSLIRTMRSSQYLFNHKIVMNNDITEATINAGWKRKIGAVANEDNLKKQGQGWDIIINDGYNMEDCEKIVASGVPESDLALAQQMADLIFKTSGIDLENWSGQNDKQTSSLTLLIKQAANLMVFQKYFDQWDFSDKLLGDLLIQIPLNNWNAPKVGMIIGEEPTPHFYSKVFAKYQVIVEESDLTPTQQNLQAQQMMDINQIFGREVFPPSMIIPKLNITGKGEIIPYLQQQEEQAQAVQSEATNIQHAFEEMKLKELMSKAVANIAMAKERHGRAESNVGLFEERLSEISKNRALSTKAKMESLEKLVDVIGKYGEIETALKMNEIETFDYQQEANENREKSDAKATGEGNEFMMEMVDQLQGNEINQQLHPQQNNQENTSQNNSQGI